MDKEQPPPYSPPPPGFVSPPTSQQQPPLQPMHYPAHEQPPLQPMYPTHVPAGVHSNVIVTTVTPMHFGPNSQQVICPSCHARISTEVKNEPNQRTHLFALLLCLFQCYCCCCIPYCVDSCQSQNHYCPKCHAFLGGFSNA